jgi:hypothetical protein
MGSSQHKPMAAGVAASPACDVGDYLPAGFAFSCLGFLFFLSFFWELLPLPMTHVLAM